MAILHRAVDLYTYEVRIDVKTTSHPQVSMSMVSHTIKMTSPRASSRAPGLQGSFHVKRSFRFSRTSHSHHHRSPLFTRIRRRLLRTFDVISSAVFLDCADIQAGGRALHPYPEDMLNLYPWGRISTPRSSLREEYLFQEGINPRKLLCLQQLDGLRELFPAAVGRPPVGQWIPR